MEIKEYVLGFLFNVARTRVVLIEKQKPEDQRGLLNGVGGKIEWKIDKFPSDAMTREFLEDTGVNSTQIIWTEYCELFGEEWNVLVFKAFAEDSVLDAVESITNEKVAVYNINELGNYKTLSNLSWLIGMALDTTKKEYAVTAVID